MSRYIRTSSAILLMLALVITTTFVVSHAIGSDEIDILRVGPSREYKTISDALGDSSRGSIIEVDAGTYRENLVLLKKVVLRGAGDGRPILEPDGSGPVLETFADNCTVSGLEIHADNGMGEGIRLSSDNNIVKDCLISAPANAIVLNGSMGNLIDNNQIRGVPQQEDQDPSQNYARPKGYWKLDGPYWMGVSGEVKDSSGYGSSGTAKGNTRNVAGIVNNCAKFDGEGDHIAVDHKNALDIAGPELSMEAWVNIEDMKDRQIIVDKEESYEFMISRGNISWAIMTTRMEWYWVHTEVSIPIGTWTHVAVTYDSSYVRTYVDRVLVHNESYPYGNVRTSSLPFTIGSGYKWYGGWEYAWFTKGMIDEVKVYDVCIDYTGPGLEPVEIPAGILIDRSTDNTFVSNSIEDFEGHGVLLSESSENLFRENLARNNRYKALAIGKQSSVNSITLNDIVGNNGGSDQALDDGPSNMWDVDGMGNFWSDWTMPDSDIDLVVDHPYSISGEAGAKDRYPLIRSSDSPEAPVILTTDVQQACVGNLYLVKYTAQDKDSQEEDLEWGMTTNASWLSFNSLHVLKGTPSRNDTGWFWVNITVTDGSLSDMTNFTVTVIENGSGPCDQLEGYMYFLGEDSHDDGVDSSDIFPGAGGVPDISVDGAENIDVTIDASGRIRFTPASDWSGSEIILITATMGNWSAVAKVIITVSPENDAPTNARFTHQLLHYDQVQLLDLKGESDDVDIPYGDVLTYTWYVEGIGVVGHGEYLTIELEPGTYDVTMRVSDLEGEFSDVTSEIVIVEPAEDTGKGGGSGRTPVFLAIMAATVLLVLIALLLTLLFLIRRSSIKRGGYDFNDDITGKSGGGSGITGRGHVPGEVRAGSLGVGIPGTGISHTVFGGESSGISPYIENLEVGALVMSPPPDDSTIDHVRSRLDEMRRVGGLSQDTYDRIRTELDRYN
ncbi:MAG: LamG-like jellyroll fold domain-containing protein [Thermoplasmatota archaeon]